MVVGCGDRPSVPPVVETLVEGLNNPTGIAAPAAESLIVAESGAGRLITVATDGMTAPLIEGFQLGTYFPYDIGPLSVLVRSDGSIIVGEGGERIGRERLSFWDAGGAPQPDATLTPPGGGNFYGLAIHPATGDLYAASSDTNRIFRATSSEGGTFAAPSEFVADTTQPPINLAAPTSLAFEADGSLLVGFADETGGGIDRLATGAQGASLLIDALYQTDGMVTAVAVRPSDAAVFFAEFTAADPERGRVARLTSDGGIEEVAADVSAPSALAFAPDDTLFVATLGDTPNAQAGAILRIRFPASAQSAAPPNDIPPDTAPMNTPPPSTGPPAEPGSGTDSPDGQPPGGTASNADGTP